MKVKLLEKRRAKLEQCEELNGLTNYQKSSVRRKAMNSYDNIIAFYIIDTAYHLAAILFGYGITATYWAHLVRTHQVNVAKSRGGDFSVSKENCGDNSSSYLWHEFICIYSAPLTSEKDQGSEKRRRSEIAFDEKD